MNIKNTRPFVFGLLILLLVFSTGLASAQKATPQAKGLTARITQVDASQFPRVTVYVSVTNAAGEPVGVSPSQIVLEEDGVPMTPEEISGAGDIGPLTTMLVMDVSGSMNHYDKLPAAQAAARAYVDQSRPGDQIGLLTFNTRVEYVQPITQERRSMLEAIDSLKAKDDTALYDALARAIDLLEAVSGRKAIIALSDGLDNRSKISPQEILQRIGPSGLSISTIGLGDPTQSHSSLSSLDEGALSALAEQAGGAYGYANDAASLQRLYELYGRAMQSEYKITYSSPSKLRDGVNRRLNVRLVDASEVDLSAPAQVDYNPGGLVPEVPQPASWGWFVAILGGLLLLLLLPWLVGKVLTLIRSRGGSSSKPKVKTSRVKLKD